MLAVNISFLAVPGVLTPDSPAIQIIIYCSVVSSIASIVFSFAMSNVYSDPGLADAEIAVCFYDRYHVYLWCSRWALIGGFHGETQSRKLGDGMPCDHAQPSDCLPSMVVRHFNQ